MPTLRISIDLSRLPDGIGEPNEVSVILRELADWIESRSEPYAVTNKPKALRGFESQIVGTCNITP